MVENYINKKKIYIFRKNIRKKLECFLSVQSLDDIFLSHQVLLFLRAVFIIWEL